MNDQSTSRAGDQSQSRVMTEAERAAAKADAVAALEPSFTLPATSDPAPPTRATRPAQRPAANPKQKAADEQQRQRAERDAQNAKATEQASAAEAERQDRLDELTASAAQDRARLRDLEQQIAALSQQQNQPVPEGQILVIRSTALNVAKSQEHLEEISPPDGRLKRQIIVAKSFHVEPYGKSSHLPQAIVDNCADEGDAKSAYCHRVRCDPVAAKLRIVPVETEPRQPRLAPAGAA